MSRLLQTLLGSAAESGCGITTGEPAAPARRTWGEVHAEARRTMGALVADGLAPGDAVAVLAGEPAPIAPAVQGVWLAGGSVTMLHQPTPRIELAAWAQDTVTVLKMISCRTVLLGPPFDALGPVLDDHGVAYRLLTDLHGEPADLVEIGEDATALLQLTSGSTAEPKAVRITHGNLHANITAMAATAALDRGTDVLVSWLPLFHDMGMVGFLTVPMTFGLELVTVTPADFLSGPLLWAELISRHRGTVTAAPNFAYALLARRLVGTGADDLDLSSLRFALNGAEPIDPAAVRAFLDAGARFGLDPRCVVCAYGLAEATLAVSFAPRDGGLVVDTIDATELESHRRAVPAQVVPSHDAGTRGFPVLGPPLPGLQVQAVDDAGLVLGEREVGLLRVRGEAVTTEYLTVDGPVPTQDIDGRRDRGLRAPQGRHHHGWAQRVPDRHRARRRRGGRGARGQCRRRAPRRGRPAGVFRGAARVPRRGRRGHRAGPAPGRHRADRRRHRAAAGAGRHPAADVAAQDTVGQAAPRRGTRTRPRLTGCGLLNASTCCVDGDLHARDRCSDRGHTRF